MSTRQEHYRTAEALLEEAHAALDSAKTIAKGHPDAANDVWDTTKATIGALSALAAGHAALAGVGYEDPAAFIRLDLGTDA